MGSPSAVVSEDSSVSYFFSADDRGMKTDKFVIDARLKVGPFAASFETEDFQRTIAFLAADDFERRSFYLGFKAQVLKDSPSYWREVWAAAQELRLHKIRPSFHSFGVA